MSRASPPRGLPMGWALWLLGLSVAASAFAQAPGSGTPAAWDGEAYAARVTRVSDGDTLWVQPLAGGRLRKLRLDGLDAPEICQAGGTAARDALAARVLGQVVVVHERSRDDHGRALVRLQHAGNDVGAFMVGQGHAWSYRWRHNPGPYVQQERQARALNRGLFADASAEVPRDFRRRHGPCPLPAR